MTTFRKPQHVQSVQERPTSSSFVQRPKQKNALRSDSSTRRSQSRKSQFANSQEHCFVKTDRIMKSNQPPQLVRSFTTATTSASSAYSLSFSENSAGANNSNFSEQKHLFQFMCMRELQSLEHECDRQTAHDTSFCAEYAQNIY